MSSKPSHYTKSIASRSKTHYMPYISHLYTSTNSFRPSLYHINAVDLATFNDKDKLKKKTNCYFRYSIARRSIR